jgi:hypothetical protein
MTEQERQRYIEALAYALKWLTVGDAHDDLVSLLLNLEEGPLSRLEAEPADMISRAEALAEIELVKRAASKAGEGWAMKACDQAMVSIAALGGAK